MELDSRKNEARSDMKQQDIAIEVSDNLVYRTTTTFGIPRCFGDGRSFSVKLL